MNSLTPWIWLTLKDGIGMKKRSLLIRDFQSADKVFRAKESEFAELSYLTKSDISMLCDKNTDFIQSYIQAMKNNHVEIITLDDARYPELLKQIEFPPLVLYARGKWIDLNECLCISVVGARKATEYGLNTAYRLSKAMAQKGTVIVSGMALGVDAMAHKGALAAGMPTVAVIGCGINIVYPKANAMLMEQILQQGMVISEYPLNSPPLKNHFPERNRIIAALSVATVVTEADTVSGSLITAKCACEQGKDVYAVPGNIDSRLSEGTNSLIKDGAYPVTGEQDILMNYQDRYSLQMTNALQKYQSKPSKPPMQEADAAKDTIVAAKNSVAEKPNTAMKENLKSEAAVRKSEKQQTEPQIEPQSEPQTEAEFVQIAQYNVHETQEDLIFNILTPEPVTVDVLCERTGLSAAELNASLLIMELGGRVKKHQGNRYSLYQ